MTLLLDTGALAWVIDPDAVQAAPSAAAEARIEREDRLVVSSMSFFEIAQKVRLGKWPEMAEAIKTLGTTCDGLGIIRIAPDEEIALAAALMRWDHRDPFDRIIVATARALDCPVVTTDRQFQGVIDVLR